MKLYTYHDFGIKNISVAFNVYFNETINYNIILYVILCVIYYIHDSLSKFYTACTPIYHKLRDVIKSL